MRINSIRNIASINTIYNYNYAYNYSNIYFQYKNMRKPKRSTNKSKYKLSPKNLEKINKKIIDIMELYKMETHKSRTTRSYRQLNNNRDKIREVNVLSRKAEAYNERDIIDFQKRKERIEKRRTQNNQNENKKEGYKKTQVQAENQKAQTQLKAKQNDFKKSLQVERKTPKEIAYEKAWADFEKALKERKIIDRELKQCGYREIKGYRRITFDNEKER